MGKSRDTALILKKIKKMKKNLLDIPKIKN